MMIFNALLLLCTTTLTLAKDNLTFLALGDYGNYPKIKNVKAIAYGMDKWSQSRDTDFLLNLGDSFYEWGVKSAEDPQFETWRKTFSYPTMTYNWYGVLGNHDYGMVGWPTRCSKKRGQAQLDYTKKSEKNHEKYDPRWQIPAYNYKFTRSFNNPITNETVTASFIGIDTYSYYNLTEVEELLQSVYNASDWIFVFGHVPVLTPGKHYKDDHVRSKQNSLMALLEKYKVATYFSGHDHVLGHIIDKDNDSGDNDATDYVVSGSGAKLDPIKSKALKNIEDWDHKAAFKASQQGFASVTLYSKTAATIDFVDNQGNSIYSYQKKNPKLLIQRPSACRSRPGYNGFLRELWADFKTLLGRSRNL
eukprot:Pgem_evm1s1011